MAIDHISAEFHVTPCNNQDIYSVFTEAVDLPVTFLSPKPTLLVCLKLYQSSFYLKNHNVTAHCRKKWIPFRRQFSCFEKDIDVLLCSIMVLHTPLIHPLTVNRAQNRPDKEAVPHCSPSEDRGTLFTNQPPGCLSALSGCPLPVMWH